jgi:putative membrane protein
MISSRMTFRAVAALTLLTAIACKRRDEYSRVDSTGASAAAAPRMTDSAMGTVGGSASAATPGAMTDANIVAALDEANVADSTHGAIAATKGTSADVRSFGKMMMGEHHMLRQQGMDLAKSANITPSPMAGSQTQAQMQQLSDSLNAQAKGAAWDKAYIAHEIQVHQDVLNTLQTAETSAQNAELKALITKARPIVQKHLDRAQEIQKKLGT